MFFEGFFDETELDAQDIINHYYVLTLSAWITYNEMEIYEQMMKYFEEKENYYICEGINRALAKIDEVTTHRFSEATPLEEDDERKTFGVDEYKQVSRRVFTDIMTEIYERQFS